VAKAKVGKYEIDFLIGRTALEIDGNIHRIHNSEKDTELMDLGYVPVHITTARLGREQEKQLLSLINSNQ
jgi:very-short-patch-repair endonuclease